MNQALLFSLSLHHDGSSTFAFLALMYFPHLFVQQTYTDPPTVVVETSSLKNLEDKKDPATLRCLVDSNPPSSVIWRKEGMEAIFSKELEIVFSPVTRHTAGTYTCTAENALGMSKPAFIDIDVKCKF